ncbi:MAG: DUF3180 domain-containing protein [Haloechinothrix sp.]
MHFTRIRDLLLAGLIGLGFGYLVFLIAYSAMPSLPTFAGGTLLVLAMAELALAFWVRDKIRSAHVTGPIVIARMVALAKASSLLGAIMSGGWLGAALYLLPRDELAAARQDTPSTIIGAVCAAVLVGAALWLEQSCRTPEPRDRDHVDETKRP